MYGLLLKNKLSPLEVTSITFWLCKLLCYVHCVDNVIKAYNVSEKIGFKQISCTYGIGSSKRVRIPQKVLILKYFQKCPLLVCNITYIFWKLCYSLMFNTKIHWLFYTKSIFNLDFEIGYWSVISTTTHNYKFSFISFPWKLHLFLFAQLP